MRCRLLLAVPPLAVLVLVIGAFWLFPGSSPGPAKANFDRIKEGMTRQEVEALLGKDAIAVESSEGGTLRWQFSFMVYVQDDRSHLIPTNRIEVDFLDDIVQGKRFYPWTTADLWRHLRNRLGL
jgi:hypothetical protein